MVLKIGASRRYEPLPQGLRALTALGGPARKGNPTLARRQNLPRARLQTVPTDAGRSALALRKPPRRHARPRH